jgi:hypothetical protein
MSDQKLPFLGASSSVYPPPASANHLMNCIGACRSGVSVEPTSERPRTSADERPQLAELCLPPIGSTRPYVDSAFSSKLPFKLSVVLIYSKRLCSHVAGRRLSSYGGPSVDMFPKCGTIDPLRRSPPK